MVASGYVLFGVLFLVMSILIPGAGLIWGVLLIGVYDFLVRYVIVNEKYYIKRFEELEERDYKFDYTCFWNIRGLSDTEPMVVTFSSGIRGVYVAFERGETVGKTYQDKYDSDESVADMYREANAEKLGICHFDYMDLVCNDGRMEYLYEKLGNAQNEDIRGILGDVYNNVYSIMKNIYTTYDVCLFYGRYDANILLSKVLKILQELRGSYYRGQTILNKEDILPTIYSMYPLNDFSVNDTVEKVLTRESDVSYLRVLAVENDGEITEINKSTKELIRSKKQSKKMKSIKVHRRLGKQKDIEI